MKDERFDATAATVGDVLDMLNGFQLFRVTGGPAWMRTDRYDFIAKAERQMTVHELESAVTAMLAERSQLKSPKETRGMPGFAIHAPKASGALRAAADDEKYSIVMRDGDVLFTAMSMPSLTNYLSRMWAAPVEDQTELKGRYDFRLATSKVERRPGGKWGDWVREALEDVGFRVDERRVPLDITVVGQCERPSEN